MKRLFGHLRVFVLLAAFFLSAERSSGQVSVSFQVFYDQLAPYGSWVSYPQYGYVWIPTAVSAGFRPYGSSGHWVLTAEGWTWISDYAWGWAPFHYGNWFYDEVYGWMWIPGYEWAPAWVTWGEYNGNYCWAPIGPNVQIGMAWNTYRPPAYYWTFLPGAYMGSATMSRHYVHYNTSVTVVNRITVINNINTGGGRPQYMRGPQAGAVERYTRTRIRTVPIRESARPGRGQVQNGQAVIYRPAVNRTAARPPAPSRVQNLQSIKPANLPGHNRAVQRPGSPAKPAGNGNRPSRPAQPNPTSQQRPARPAQPHPAPAHPAPHPAHEQRPAQPNPAPQQRPAQPTQPHPAPAHEPRPAQPVHPAPQPVHEQRPVQPAPRPERPEGGRR